MGLDVKKLKWKDLSTGQSDDNNVSFEMVERGPIKLTNPLKPILQGNSRLRPLHLKWIIVGLLIGLAGVSCVAYIASSKHRLFMK